MGGWEQMAADGGWARMAAGDDGYGDGSWIELTVEIVEKCEEFIIRYR